MDIVLTRLAETLNEHSIISITYPTTVLDFLFHYHIPTLLGSNISQHTLFLANEKYDSIHPACHIHDILRRCTEKSKHIHARFEIKFTSYEWLPANKSKNHIKRSQPLLDLKRYV